MKSLIKIPCYFLIFLSNKVFAQTGIVYDVRDGKTYKTVQIGSQTWMAENLAYAPFNTDTLKRGDIKNLGESKMGIYSYGNNKILIEKFGMLYTWETAMNVCPAGWHLPTKAEFDTLIFHSGKKRKLVFKALIEGGNSGFEGVFGGVFLSEYYKALGSLGFYWSASKKKNTEKYYYLEFNNISERAFLYLSSIHDKKLNKDYFLSVRCIRN